MDELNSVSSDLNVSKSKRGGKRVGAGRKKKAPVGEIPGREQQIEMVQKQLAACTPGSRQAAVFTRQLALLTKQTKSYARSKAEKEEPAFEPPKSVREPLCWRRSGLVEIVAHRFIDPDHCSGDSFPDPYALEMLLTPEEASLALNVQFTPEQLVGFVREYIWNHTHPNELRELQESFVEDHPEIELPINTPGHWVSHLKAFPRITVNAGPTLTPDELEDVLQARAKAAMAREQVRRTLYERFPDRFLCGYKTVAEYDAAHPGASILRQLMVQPWLPEWLQQLHVRYPEMVHS